MYPSNVPPPLTPNPTPPPVQGEIGNTLQVTPYDNDVTLLYKWGEQFQIPEQYIIVRPRTAQDVAIPSGTPTKVFESLPMIVLRLHNQGESPSDMYEIIHGFNDLINVDDIMMTYYNLLRSVDPRPDLYRTINQLHRAMDEKTNVDPYEDQNSLQLRYNTWKTGLEQKMLRDQRRLATIREIQTVLGEVDQHPKIPFSPPTVNSTIVSFSPTINGRQVTIEDGLDIFNHAVVSRYVPYIRYNDSYGKPYFRVFTGDKIENEPNYAVTIIPTGDANNKNTIYMNLWLGDPENNGRAELNRATRHSFFVVVYNLENNHLTVESPIGADQKKGLIRDEQIAFQRTRSALPSLDFGEGREMKVRGDFNIWGLDFDETSFLHMVLLDPVMNVYLYVEENIKPYALKKRLDVHYRSIYTDEKEGEREFKEAYISNSAAVSVTLTPKTMIDDKIVEVMNPQTRAVEQSRLAAGTPYIHVNISQAESRDTITSFIPIFQLLMRFYLENRDQIMAIYVGDPNLNPTEVVNTVIQDINNGTITRTDIEKNGGSPQEYVNRISQLVERLRRGFLPELAALPPLLSQKRRRKDTAEPTILDVTKKTTVTRRVNAKILRLQEQAPDLFVLNYARRCQCPLQPIIVNEEEAAAWRQRRVGPTMAERQVMPYPKDNPRWNFVCPDDNNPYPGVKVNNDLPNRDIYPYVPCCFKKDQMTPGVNSHYRNYVENRPTARRVGAKAEGKISTRKILVPDRVAFLPRAVENIVKRYSDEYIDMVRYGVIYSPNSILHCVCVAIDDREYLRRTTEQQKEEYVTRIRQHMLATIRPSLLRQEMYDYADADIMDIFRDNSKFLDPALFYRAVEETFGINIYTFSQPPPSGDESELGVMDIPRFKIFHSRPLRPHRPTVVLMKSWGSESDALAHPQCELIVDYDKDNFQIMKLFGPEMTDVCHNALQETLKTITWNVIPNNFAPANTQFQARANIYYYIDHLSLFQYPAVSQFIDENGKMRALTLNVQNQLLTIVTIPSQPENLPVSTEISRVPAQFAERILGDPSGVSRTAAGLVDGLWFQIMDIPFGEYVPTVPGQGYETKPSGPANPLEASGINTTERLSKLRRTLNIIIQIVRWLYEIARATMPIDPKSFTEMFMVANQTPIEDSANYYDLSRIPRRLPQVTTVQQGIAELEPLAPTLFNQGKIVMYSEGFAVRILKMLGDYSNLHYGMPPANIDFIENFYETEADFIKNPNSKVFTSEKDLSAWRASLRSSQNYGRYFNIRRKVEIAMGYSVDPYLYQDEEGKIFIIQNVIGVGAKSKAITVAQTWNQFKVNIGPQPLASDTLPDHMLYGISPASTLIPIQDLTNGSNDFLKIVYYGTQMDKSMGKEARYGVMLEIL